MTLDVEFHEKRIKNMPDLIFFFCQAEDGIRDKLVTGVQTCALPICIAAITPVELYSVPDLPVPPQKIARQIAEFMKLPYQALLISDRVALGVLPTPFCKTNMVVAITETGGERSFVVSDPFNWEVVQMLRRVNGGKPPRLAVTEPQKILALFNEDVD